MTLNEIMIHPSTCLMVTIGSFLFARWLQEKAHGSSLLNPVVVSIILVTMYILGTGMPYADYLRKVDMITMLLGPVTVALAIPLYHYLHIIEKALIPIIVSVIVACLIAGGTGYGLAHILAAPQDIQLSIISKSSTSPVAIGIANKIGADESLAVFFVFTTGIFGALISTFLFKIARIKSETAIGFTLGTTCHALGVAKAFQYSEKAGAFAVLGMGLMGGISGIILPMIVLWLLG